MLGQELQKFFVQLDFDLSQKGEMSSELDFKSFEVRFAQMKHLFSPLIKQLEQQQSSISDKEVGMMKEQPMKKKPKNRRKKKDDTDDDLQFLDSVIAVNKKESADIERSIDELAE